MSDTAQEAIEPVTPIADWASVTNVAKIVNPGEGLLRWANRVGLEGKTLDEGRGSGTSNGTLVHRCFERLVAGDDPTEVRRTHTTQPLANYVNGLVSWWEQTGPQVLHVEASVKSLPLMVRGRIDCVRKCDTVNCHCYGEGARISDFKTGGHNLYFEPHLQGDGYREIWPDSGLDPRHLCGVEFITIDGNGTFKPQPLIAEHGDFLAALALYRAKERWMRRV